MTVEKWRKIIKEHFPDLLEGAEVIASVFCELLIKDITKPLWMIVIDVWGSGKTILVNFFSEIVEMIKSLDNLTKSAILSHAANRTNEDLENNVDLLPKMENKVLLVRDFTSLFAKDDKELRPILADFTRALDGEGLETSSGVHGTRGYKRKLLFMIAGASTPMTSRVWKLISTLGSRILTLYLNIKEDDELTLVEQNMAAIPTEDKEKICRKATSELINKIRDEGKVTWTKKEDRDLLLVIARVAKLTAYLRAVVNEDFIPMPENPRRLNRMLYNLSRGHALLCGRKHIEMEDVRLVIKVALSTTSIHRSKIINKLLNNKGKISTDDVMTSLQCSRPIAIRYMKEFRHLGLAKLIKIRETVGRPEFELKLKKEYAWFISSEFIELVYAQNQKT
jgi:predicted transcriptional regulator